MDRSTPISLGDGTSLRFDRADIKALESTLGIGYPHFTREGIFGSLTATEAFVWRGLRKENERGELVHVFTLNDVGRDKAGDTLMDYLQAGGDIGTVNDAIISGFINSGLFRARTDAKQETSPKGDAPKN